MSAAAYVLLFLANAAAGAVGVAIGSLFSPLRRDYESKVARLRSAEHLLERAFKALLHDRPWSPDYVDVTEETHRNIGAFLWTKPLGPPNYDRLRERSREVRS